MSVAGGIICDDEDVRTCKPYTRDRQVEKKKKKKKATLAVLEDTPIPDRRQIRSIVQMDMNAAKQTSR